MGGERRIVVASALLAFLGLGFGGFWLSRDVGATVALAGAVILPVWSVWLWASAGALRAMIAVPASLMTALALGILNLAALDLAFGVAAPSQEAWMQPYTLAFPGFAYWSAGPVAFLSAWAVVWLRRRQRRRSR